MRNAHGLQISRNLLCHWHDAGAQLLEPLYKLQLERLRACSHLQADEPPVDYLEPGHGKVKKGYFWVLYNPTQGVLYRWRPGRSRDHLESLLFDDKNNQRFEGVLQCDAYAVYKSLAAVHRDSIRLVSCMAHIRRKFHEALDDQPRYAAWVIKQIGRLYSVERQLRDSGADFEERRTRRQQSAKPIHRWLKRAFIGLRAHASVLPSSPMGKALDYALHQWDLLTAYLENGEIEIDNNLVENAMRPLKLGAKNCLRSTSAMHSPVSSSGDRWNDAAVAAEHWLFIVPPLQPKGSRLSAYPPTAPRKPAASTKSSAAICATRASSPTTWWELPTE